MSDNTQLNLGSGGLIYRSEELSPGLHISATKIHTGPDNTDGGSVTTSNPFPVQEVRSASSAFTSVAGSASDTTILASNAARKGATIYNDSTATLYLLCASGTSSTTAFTVKVFADDYFEVPGHYTGVVRGIWASATGAARVTEFT